VILSPSGSPNSIKEFSIAFYLSFSANLSEPEFRLVHMILALICCGVGMFGYGHFTQVGAAATTCAVFQGIMMTGVLIGTISPVAYALDAYRDSSNEIFIMNMLFKNFLFYGMSYVAND